MDSGTLIEIITTQLGLDPDDISDETDIMEDLGADSLDVAEMLMTLEDDFGIVIPEEDVVGLRKIRDVMEYIEKKA